MPFSEELTVNDIIRKLKERKKNLLEEITDPFTPFDAYSRISEIDAILNYIEKDGEY